MTSIRDTQQSRNIVTAPSPVLSQTAKAVLKIDKNISDLLQEMSNALLSAKDPVGVGLAAPQIGKSVRIFITKPTEKSPISVFINPKILSKSEEQKILNSKNSPKIEAKKPKKSQGKMLEGCLSLPNIWGEVMRNPQVTLSYLDENGKSHTKKFKGFMATLIQHEIDHLNGVLFPKRVLEQKGTLYKSERNKQNEDIFEEIIL